MASFISRNKVVLSIIVGALIIGGFIYFSQTAPLLLQQEVGVSPTVEEGVLEPTEAVSPTRLPATVTATTVPPSPTPTVSDEEVIKQGLIEKTGIPDEDLEYSISYNDGQVARGSVRSKNEISGAAWFAGKKNGEWVIAYVGQGVPECSEIEPFNFSIDWISHCMEGDVAVER